MIGDKNILMLIFKNKKVILRIMVITRKSNLLNHTIWLWKGVMKLNLEIMSYERINLVMQQRYIIKEIFMLTQLILKYKEQIKDIYIIVVGFD